jgi:PAS domain S-box-containing protein/diguanylate cyclase (GGDEF)-like protein
VHDGDLGGEEAIRELSELLRAASPTADDTFDRVALSAALIEASALLDPAAVASLAVKHARELCDVDGAALYWWDETKQMLLPLAVLDLHARPLPQVFHPGQGATGQAYATGLAVIANNYPSTVSFPPAWNFADGVCSVAAVPLIVNGEVCGVLTATQRHEAVLTDRAVQLLDLVGLQVAPTLHGMRALAQAQFRLTEARELTSLIRDTAVSTEMVPLLQRICELSCRMLGAEFAGVVLTSEGENRWSAAYGNASDRETWPREAPEWPLLAKIIDGEPFVLTELGDNPDWELARMPVLSQERLRTVLALPLVPAAGAGFGALVLGWRQDVRPSAQLVSLARTLSASATSLVAHAATETALVEGQQLWRLTLDNAPVGICLVRLDGTFRLVNAAMSRILGFTEDELMSMDFLAVSHPEHRADKKDLVDRLLYGPEDSGTIQTRCLHANGEGVWTSVSVQLVRDSEGAPAFFSAQLEDISGQHQQTEQLTHLANHDSLTGLANRRRFYELLEASLGRGAETAVALIDVPQLHGLEDRFGHLAAGEIARELADRLVAALELAGGADGAVALDGLLSSGECVARFASDEFAVMLTSMPGRPIELAVERLLRAFGSPFIVGGRSHTLAPHIGVAAAPADGSSAQDVLRTADVALTNARREGRPTRRYTTLMGAAQLYRQHLTVDLRSVLIEGGLTMVYQPIIDSASGLLVSAEGLARWTHPEHGPIGPDTFVPLAEEAGIMPALTAWALDSALAACSRWQRDKPGVGVAVNLSASDLQNPPTAALVAAALTRHHLPSSLLEVELTETTLMTDLTTALEMLNDLASLGVGLGIDDFGTGYSSLAYLQRLPMMTLKIDRSFVTDMLADEGNAAIVTMIIQLAHAFGMTTVAEGVEDLPTADHLAVLSCDRMQGYGIARPMPESAFAAWHVPARV